MYQFWVELGTADTAPVEESLGQWENTDWSLEQRPGEAARLCAYFPDEDSLEPTWELLCRQIPRLKVYQPLREVLRETDWKNHYKEFIKPFRIGPLHIVPEWMRKDYRIPAGQQGIYLDAGLAFGTGAHETTQLCLARLVEAITFRPQYLDTQSYIDAGCGSGILSIAAHKLGFRKIFGFDHDPQAITVSRENAKVNAIPDSAIDFQEADLAYGLLGRQADLLSANILAPVLKLHAGLLLHAVLPEGTLSLSGILKEEGPEIQSVFDPLARKYWQDFHCSLRTSGDWAEIAYIRKRP
ncbi:MAG: 50S ribosomal protein L11 methyltransferase [Puniceicoccales bacterium]|jgi:ribosomal protein L11 methyltransferase|nr:50S ribosomal protein L11 methyltransferase [Puniceicoccales bacterium]